MQTTLKRSELRDYVKDTNGRIFAIEFIKKDGSHRRMICRTKVVAHLKGGELAYDPVEKGLITVFDFQKRGYRSIPIERTESVQFGGIVLKVVE